MSDKDEEEYEWKFIRSYRETNINLTDPAVRQKVEKAIEFYAMLCQRMFAWEYEEEPDESKSV